MIQLISHQDQIVAFKIVGKGAAESAAGIVITLTADPTEDDIVRRAQSRISLAKRGVKTNISRAEKTAASIPAHKSSGKTGQNLIIAKMIQTGADYSEAATTANTELEGETDRLVRMLEEIKLQFNNQQEKCDTMIR